MSYSDGGQPAPAGSVPIRFRTALDHLLSGKTKAVMHYQPIVDLRRGTVAGYEALVRFPAPPAFPPDEWFQSAALRGKRLQLEALAASLAFADREKLPPSTFLTLNLSPVFLLSDEFNRLMAPLQDLNSIVLEITEGDRIADYPAVRRRLDRVRAMGGHIAVDDTGSGYASLKHVMELRPQFVKLDRFFVQSCQDEPAKAEMIHMIGEAADRMDAWLIAEGIETDSELNEVMRCMVPLGQGFLLGRPAPEMAGISEEIAQLLQARQCDLPGEGLSHLMENTPHFLYPNDALAALQTARRGTCAAVLDVNDRPESVLELHPLLGVRELPIPMRVSVGSHGPDVLRRALSRSLPQRFDPIVVTGERGNFLGILRVDRMMHSILLQTGDPPMQ